MSRKQNRREYFPIAFQEIHRDDVRNCYRHKHLTDDILTDEVMETIAEEMGNAMVNDGWYDILQVITTIVLDNLKRREAVE